MNSTSNAFLKTHGELSPEDFSAYNRVAEKMDEVHNLFRHKWNTLYSACCDNRLPAGITIPEFMTLGLEFCRQLESHHSIEDLHVFPILSRKMPDFQKEEHLPQQHKEIHLGLDQIRAYLNSCTSGESELNLTQMKEIMDGFSKVLWTHLDEEVRALGAENMRKHWTIQEIDEMMMM